MALPSDAVSIGGGLYEDSAYTIYDSQGNALGTDNFDNLTYTDFTGAVVNFPAGVNFGSTSGGGGSSSSSAETNQILTDVGSALGLGSGLVKIFGGGTTTTARPAPTTAPSATVKYMVYGIILLIAVGIGVAVFSHSSAKA